MNGRDIIIDVMVAMAASLFISRQFINWQLSTFSTYLLNPLTKITFQRSFRSKSANLIRTKIHIFGWLVFLMFWWYFSGPGNLKDGDIRRNNSADELDKKNKDFMKKIPKARWFTFEFSGLKTKVDKRKLVSLARHPFLLNKWSFCPACAELLNYQSKWCGSKSWNGKNL